MDETLSEMGAVFGSRTLSRLLGPPPKSVMALLRSGSPRGAASLATHSSYYAARGVSRIVAAAFDEAPDWVGWWAWQLCVGGIICVATGLLFWATLRGVAAGETYVESLKRKNGFSSRGSRRAAEEDSPDASSASLERSCPPVLHDCSDCVTCGCVTGSAGPLPWSRVGAFHLRQVFGSGPVRFWGAPLVKPPVGARNGARTSKKGK